MKGGALDAFRWALEWGLSSYGPLMCIGWTREEKGRLADETMKDKGSGCG